MVIAIPFAARYGTPLPIALNEFVKVMFLGIMNSFGKDWIESASATEILLALYGCK